MLLRIQVLLAAVPTVGSLDCSDNRLRVLRLDIWSPVPCRRRTLIFGLQRSIAVHARQGDATSRSF